jgi:hypothetical protein
MTAEQLVIEHTCVMIRVDMNNVRRRVGLQAMKTAGDFQR